MMSALHESVDLHLRQSFLEHGVLRSQEREDPTLTEWDRFARTQYVRLAMEEEGEDIEQDQSEVWSSGAEAAFA